MRWKTNDIDQVSVSSRRFPVRDYRNHLSRKAPKPTELASEEKGRVENPDLSDWPPVFCSLYQPDLDIDRDMYEGSTLIGDGTAKVVPLRAGRGNGDEGPIGFPERSLMLLIGSGLIGIAAFAEKRYRQESRTTGREGGLNFRR